MRIFVTGATGFVGSAVVRELLSAGHEVLGLVRNPTAALPVGAEPLPGNVEDHDSLRRGVEAADAVIHTAFNHDFSKYLENCENDRRAIAAMGEVLGHRPMVVTSGIGILPAGRLLEERAVPVLGGHARAASEEAAAALMAAGRRVSIMRLPPSVHGAGDHGFVPVLIGIARQKGLSGCPGEGRNRWPAVHRDDAARLYRLAVEKGEGGERYHAVAEEGVPFREIAAVIARRLGLPLGELAPEAAEAHFGWFARFAGLDVPASSAWTRGALGWEPRGPGLIEDIDQPGYFAV
ncbi:SDR family oxidoreductase [Acetobacteraceae bacterium H6797]|nr:SDR family oxidoreductase [Acetobacteraceae bacterium H6797]